MHPVPGSDERRHGERRARAPTLLFASIALVAAFGEWAGAGAPERDGDCDGILSPHDRCPNQAEDRDGHADSDGCPDPDNDGDSLVDSADTCPDEAEVVNDYQDADGCPDKVVAIDNDRIEVKQRILFASNKAVILARSYPILDEIAEAAREHPEVGVLRIEGHADDRGTIRHNLRLSERRAKAVFNHLVGLGIEPARLVHLGHGETRRHAAGSSKGARAQNRRVQFVVEFSLVRPSEHNAVRDAAIARADTRQGTRGTAAAASTCPAR